MRKIELQSPEDLRYLVDNVSRAAREKIDLHLPPNAAPEGEDALRRRVEELVQEVST
jgi:kinetochor protein Mis14/NSL1